MTLVSSMTRPEWSVWQSRAVEAPAVLSEVLMLCQSCAVDPSECADVLDLLIMLGCDAQTQAAALWFALAQVEPAHWEAASATLPAELRRLVEGQQAAEQVWTLHAQRTVGSATEGLRRLLLAVIRDVRVVCVLLARQLAKMRAASTMAGDDERRALAWLTANIHAPLANRLGIWQLKWELEDLAFCYLQPDRYRPVSYTHLTLPTIYSV